MPIRIKPSDARKLGVVVPRVRGVDRPKKVKPDFTRAMFLVLCASHGLPTPLPEFRFAKPRKWAFDYAWPQKYISVALEIEGGTWRKGGGAHRGTGFLRDIKKYNEAVLLGWRILRCTPDDVKSGEVFELLKRAMP